jgi:peptide/nickel transport system ATP-binding protein
MGTLLEVVDLKKYFPVRRGVVGYFKEKPRYVPAVDDVSFKVEEGETIALVGESGSGKTTLGRLILRLIEPTSGKILFEGKDITSLKGKELKDVRRKMQIVFQDPYAALSPRQTVRKAMEEPLIIHNLYEPEEREEIIAKMLRAVGLNPPEFFMNKYPHELSGGQRQRVCIARALILNPKFMVMDEPVSLLDATVRVQILKLINEVKDKLNLTYIFITHDVALGRYVSNKMIVLYQGRIMEAGDTESLINNPMHPYTKTLISAVPVPDPEVKLSIPPKAAEIEGSLITSEGCRFHPRCPYATQKCRVEVPPLELVDDRMVACWNYRSVKSA